MRSDLLFAGAVGQAVIRGDFPIWAYIALFFVLAAASYLLGSVNFAIVISNLKYHDDIRNHGSGNAGATNMKRTFGNKAAALTFAGDFLKAVLAVLGTRLLIGFDAACLSGLACALGHAFPCWYGFKGGKCVAVTSAIVLCVEPITFAIALVIFVIIVAFTKYVSLGSIISALMIPLVMYNILNGIYGLGHGTWGIFCIFLTCVLVVALHKENIKRLREGKENKIGSKKSE